MRLALSLSILALFSAGLTAHADTLYSFNGSLVSGTTFVGTIAYSPTGGFPVGATYTAVALTFSDGSMLDQAVRSDIGSGTHEYTYSNLFFLITSSSLMGYANDPVCTLTQLCADENNLTNSVASLIQGQQVETAYITTQETSVTPEPESIALLSTGLLGLVGLIRKHNG